MKFLIYRYSLEKDKKPHMQPYELLDEKIGSDMMLLDALKLLKAQDDSLTFRHSCGEGNCGSDGVNVNGKNCLACITPLSHFKNKLVVIRPLPGQPVIRDLVVDMTNFYSQYESVEPYLQSNDPEPSSERLQSPDERARLDGLYECILCGCCSTSCPSFWWNPDKFKGPAALLQSARFIFDSRDGQKQKRLDQLNDSFSLYRCKNIMNCTSVCPKDLNPSEAIGKIKREMIKDSV